MCPTARRSAVALAYEVPAYRLDVQVALTNKVPVTPVRGAGQPQGVFVMERLLDRVARELGLDRAEVRRRNLVPASKMPYQTPVKNPRRHAGRARQRGLPALPAGCAGARRMGWVRGAAGSRARGGRYIGIGLANFVEGTGRGPFETVTRAHRRLRPDSCLYRRGRHGAKHEDHARADRGRPARRRHGECHRRRRRHRRRADLGMGGFNSRQAVHGGLVGASRGAEGAREGAAIAAHLLEAGEADLEIEGALGVT